MAKYAVTPEGVAALKKCSTSLTQSLETVKSAITDISTLATDNKEGLGPHADEVESIISSLQSFTKDAQTPVDTLSKKLDGLAGRYNAIIAKKLGGSEKKITASGAASAAVAAGAAGAAEAAVGGGSADSAGSGVRGEYTSYSNSIFRNNDRLPEYHELSQRDGATFTPMQKASIYHYSCEGGKYTYKSVNGLLRDSQFQLSPGESKDILQRQIDALTECLNGKSLDRQAKFYRGVKSLSDVLGEDLSSYSPDEIAQKYTGVEYIDRSFTSATCSQNIAQKFADASLKKDPAIIQIRAPKGTNAAFIGSASSFGETEYEVLVQRNARFRIEKIKYMNQQYYVTLTLLGIFS